MVSVKEEASYKNFGKCLSISNGAMEILVTVDIGPRIIRCALTGHDNIMFEDINRSTVKDVSPLYGEGKIWNLYGGHRLWFSPEKFPDTYYPDNEKVVYTVKPSGAEFIPSQQDKTGLQLAVSISMSDTEPSLTITHTITNTSRNTAEGGAWALSAMDAGGLAIIPQSKNPTGLLPNRVVSLWDYTDMSDPRIFWGRDYIAVRSDPENQTPLKIGIVNTFGKVAYINHGQALVKSFEHISGAAYPDFGVSTEVYACGMFTEAETLSPLVQLKKGDAVKHTENWTLSEAQIPEKVTEDSACALAAKLF